MKYLVGIRHGFMNNLLGVDSDAPRHAISENTHRAICGQGPGRGGKGWVYKPAGSEAISCEGCNKIIARRAKAGLDKKAA